MDAFRTHMANVAIVGGDAALLQALTHHLASSITWANAGDEAHDPPLTRLMVQINEDDPYEFVVKCVVTDYSQPAGIVLANSGINESDEDLNVLLFVTIVVRDGSLNVIQSYDSVGEKDFLANKGLYWPMLTHQMIV